MLKWLAELIRDTKRGLDRQKSLPSYKGLSAA